jgi:mono/diheme cytochrome c family protein
MPERSPDPRMDESTSLWMLVGVGVMAFLVLAFAVYFPLESRSRADASVQSADGGVAAGQDLFAKNCVACHGDNATGGIAPALNSKQFLNNVSDDQIRSIISTGIPGSQMAAWGQEYFGPFTAEQIHDVAAYLRSLEENAPDRPDWRDMLYGTTTTSAATTTTAAS